jgi:hypothetical protein
VSNETSKRMAKAVLTLRAVDRRAWDDFLAVLASRSAEIDTSLVSANPEHIHLLQGRAQEARLLLTELHQAPEMAEQLYQKERHNGVTPPRRT